MSAVASVQPTPKKKKNKDYSNTIRVFDKDGYRLRADSVCFKDDSKQEVLMVSSRNEDGWSIPGGGLEPNEQADNTAVREALEEAGVTAEILEYIGCFNDDERKTRTKVYTLVITDEANNWKEKKECFQRDSGFLVDNFVNRDRRWFKCDEAVRIMMAKKPLKGHYLQKACESRVHSVAAMTEGERTQPNLHNGTACPPAT